MTRRLRNVALGASVVGVVMFTRLGWVWPLVVAMGVLAVCCVVIAEARS